MLMLKPDPVPPIFEAATPIVSEVVYPTPPLFKSMSVIAPAVTVMSPTAPVPLPLVVNAISL